MKTLMRWWTSLEPVSQSYLVLSFYIVCIGFLWLS